MNSSDQELVLAGRRQLSAKKGPKTFCSKRPESQRLINEALELLDGIGVLTPELTGRRLERMAMAFLAVVDVHAVGGWSQARDLTSGVTLKTRDIIEYVNQHFGEEISSGSYDDIRRQDLKLLVLAGLVLASGGAKDTNDPTRGYALNPEFTSLVRSVGTPSFWPVLKTAIGKRKSLAEILAQKRNLTMVPIRVSNGKVLEFSSGKHNELQKAICEQFLTRFGNGAEVLYVGDAADKHAHHDETRLRELRVLDLSRGKLPDVVAYSATNNWLFLIEAVYSSGPVSPVRLLELQRLTADCPADRIYVTAFPDRATFRKFCPEIAWETEVWIAEMPEHLIHFNGDKFLGPHRP